MKPLNQMNQHIATGLTNALGAVYHLQAHSCTVLQVDLGQRNAVIWIERPSTVLQGSIHNRVVCNGKVVTTYVTRVRDCEVRWEAEGHETREAVGL